MAAIQPALAAGIKRVFANPMQMPAFEGLDLPRRLRHLRVLPHSGQSLSYIFKLRKFREANS
jgi:hypothetical protein